MFAYTGDLDFRTTSGDINVRAGTNGNIELVATGAITFAAGQDLTLHSDSLTINETANVTNLSAVRDVFLETSNWNQPSVSHVVNVDAGRNVNLSGAAGPTSSTSMTVGGRHGRRQHQPHPQYAQHREQRRFYSNDLTAGANLTVQAGASTVIGGGTSLAVRAGNVTAD